MKKNNNKLTILLKIIAFTTCIQISTSANAVYFRQLADNEVLSLIDEAPKIDKNFFTGLNHSIDYYRRLPSTSSFKYNDVIYSPAEMISGLQLFKCITKSSKNKSDFQTKLLSNFDIYETKNDNGKALITGYYTPILNGSYTQSNQFYHGLYKNPDKSQKLPMTRQQIDQNPEAILKPLVYVDSRLDQYFTHIQGSVLVKLQETGETISVGFDGNNNYTYRPIGKILIDEGKIAKEDMSMQEIRRYVEKNPQELERLIAYDPSFVFFRKTKFPTGNIGYPVIGNVSIAMDYRIMPKGSLAFIKTTIPDIRYKDSDYTKRQMPRVPYSRFKLVQDTGGAIKGGGRVDVYFGEGKDAEFYAGMMAEDGRVLLLVAKKDVLYDPAHPQKIGCN